MSTPNKNAPGQSRKVDRSTWWVAGIALLAFVLRLIYVLQTRSNPFFDEPVMDPKYHVDWARAFAAGEVFQEGPFFRAPLYPWFLGGLFKLFGDGLLLPRIVQCGLGSLTTVLVFLIGRDAFDRRTGLLASLGAATYWVLIYFDGELLIPTLAVPLNLLALWLTLRTSEDLRPRAALLAGLVWGLAAIARPNVLLLMPVLFVWFLWKAWGDRRRALFVSAALTLGTLVPVLPLTAYNIAQGDFALIATQAGVNLWIGNNPDHAARGDVSSAIVPGTRPGWWEGFDDAVALAQLEEGRDLKPSEISSHYSRKAWGWVFSEPGAALQHWFLKMRLFWSVEELGNNQPVRGFARRFGPLTRFLPLGFCVLAPLGLLGLCLVLFSRDGQRARLLPLWAFLIVYTLTVVAFFINGRFRLPIIPILLILGAHSVFWLWKKGQERALRPLAGALLFLLASAALTLSAPAKYQQDEATTFYQLAVAATQNGDHAEALEQFDLAISARPTFLQARTGKATALLALGRIAEVEPAFQAALALGVSDRELLNAYAAFLLTADRGAEAVSVAQTLVDVHPSFGGGFYTLGRAYGKVGDVARSAQAFRDGLQRDPDDTLLNIGLGTVLGMQREFGAAVQPLETAYRSAFKAGWASPEQEQGNQALYWRSAGQLYQMQYLAGLPQAAEEFLAELQARHPGDPRLAEVQRHRPR